jgi:hypothetical protein
LLSTAWLLPGGEVCFAFFSHKRAHFHVDQIALVDYFNPWRQAVSYLDDGRETLREDERRWVTCAPCCS